MSARFWWRLGGVVLCCGPSVACAPQARPPARRAAAPQVTTNTQQNEDRWLRDTARTAAAVGAGPLQVLAFGSGSIGDHVEGFVYVPEGQCVLAYARSSLSIDDLDLHAYGDDGALFGIDEAPDDLPTLLLCPEKSTRLYVSARIAQGQGMVSVGVQTVPSSAAESVARAMGVRGRGSDPSELDSGWPGLDENLAAHRLRIGGKWIDHRRVALPVDSRVATRLTVQVPSNRCLDALLLPSEEVSQITLTASDDQGRTFARSERSGEGHSLLFCAEQATAVDLAIRPLEGQGSAVLALSVSRAPKAEEDLDLDGSIHMLPRAVAGDPGTSATGRAQERRIVDVKLGVIRSVDLVLRGCTRVELFPLGQGGEYQARIWSDAGELLAEANEPSAAELFPCFDGKARLDLEPTEGLLQVAYAASPLSSPSPLLQVHPLAASRLLRRLHASGIVDLPARVGKVHLAELTSERLLRVPLSIPVAHCAALTLGRAQGGWGVEARLIEASTGVELDSSRGSRSAQVSACAPRGRHLDSVLELRASSGQGQALYVIHQSKRDDGAGD